MKTTKRKIQAVLTIISLALVVFVAAAYSAAGKPSLSKKEVKALIASAKTKEDHLKLADFYKGEAVRWKRKRKITMRWRRCTEKTQPDGRKTSEAFGEGHCKEIARTVPRVCR